jgi:hypothetical protein
MFIEIGAPGCRPASPGFIRSRVRDFLGVHPARALRFPAEDIRIITQFFLGLVRMGEQEIFQRIGGGMSTARGESQDGER